MKETERVVRQFHESWGMREVGISTFLAMASSRDGENILTANRLEEIRSRMAQVENTTVCILIYVWHFLREKYLERVELTSEFL